MSDISRLSAISSKLEEVAFSIWSSNAELDANQPAMMGSCLESTASCVQQQKQITYCWYPVRVEIEGSDAEDGC